MQKQNTQNHAPYLPMYVLLKYYEKAYDTLNLENSKTHFYIRNIPTH